MDRSEIETAISDLDVLLERVDASEHDYQAWFERHPIVFSAYGYQRYLARPRIECTEAAYIPDFLTQRVDGLWEIFELKTPQTAVIKNRDRRQAFYASFEEYVSQCRDYSKALEQEVVRERFNSNYEVDVQDSVHSVIIAGRKADLDLHRVYRLLFDRGAKVELQTYDHVRDRLEFYRAQLFAKDENSPGLSIHLIVVPEKLAGRDNYLLDIGVDPARNRVSIYVNTSDEICFRIIDAAGIAYPTRVQMHQVPIVYGVPVYLSFELGIAANYSYAAIEVNGRYFCDRRIDRLDIDAIPLGYYVLGSDVRGEEHTHMAMIEIAVDERTLKFDEKQYLRAGFAKKYEECFSQPPILPQRLYFSGNQFLHSDHHPNFLGGQG